MTCGSLLLGLPVPDVLGEEDEHPRQESAAAAGS